MQIGAIGSSYQPIKQVQQVSDDQARKYAEQKGISIEEAKQELKVMLSGSNGAEGIDKAQGAPPPPPPKGGDSENDELINQLKSLGIPESIINRGISAIEEYAKNNNIEIPNISNLQITSGFAGMNQIGEMNKMFIHTK